RDQRKDCNARKRPRGRGEPRNRAGHEGPRRSRRAAATGTALLASGSSAVMIRLLVVDDAIEHAQMVTEFLRASGAWPHAEIKIAASYDEALAKLTAPAPFDLAVVDYMLGSRDGLELLRELKQRGIDTSVIVLTGHGAEDVAVEAMKAGAADYLSKSTLTIEGLERAVRFALALRIGERQRRQAEAALRASEERVRA